MGPTDARPLENGNRQTQPLQRPGFDGLAGKTTHALTQSGCTGIAIAQFTPIGARCDLSKLRVRRVCKAAAHAFHTRPPSPVNSRLQKLPP